MQSESGKSEHGIEEEMKGLRESEKELLVDLIRSLRDIRYGHIQITVHDSMVTQIDRTQKLRIGKSGTIYAGGNSQKTKN
jgi:hypothetical protein